MLSRFPWTILFVISILGLTLSASADTEQNASSAIKAAYANMDKALANQDSVAYTAYLLPSFIGEYSNGKVIHGKDEDAASLHQLFSMAKTVTSSTRLLSCSLQNGGAIVTTEETLSLSGINGGSQAIIKSTDTMRSFWLKSDGHWLMKRERFLSEAANGTETVVSNNHLVGTATTGSSISADVPRLIETEGGFSYVPPIGWQVKTFPGLKYKLSCAKPSGGFMPNINVVDESAAVSMTDYIQLTSTQLKRQFPDFISLGQTAFVTSSGIQGVRLDSEATLNGHKLRQIYYLFAGQGDRKIVVTATWGALDGDKFTQATDTSMKTFALEPSAASPKLP